MLYLSTRGSGDYKSTNDLLPLKLNIFITSQHLAWAVLITFDVCERVCFPQSIFRVKCLFLSHHKVTKVLCKRLMRVIFFEVAIWKISMKLMPVHCLTQSELTQCCLSPWSTVESSKAEWTNVLQPLKAVNRAASCAARLAQTRTEAAFMFQ